MAGSLNRAMLIGNLGDDPDIRRLASGDTVVNLRIATSESWRDKSSGEKREKTEWHTVVIFSPALTKIAEQYLKKGSKVYVDGRLQTRKWQDQGGNERYSTEIVLQPFNGTLVLLPNASGNGGQSGGDDRGGRPSGGGQRGGYGDQSGGGYGGQGRQQSSNYSRDLDDEIPF